MARKSQLAVDILLCLLMIATVTFALVQEAAHECVGVAVILAGIAHLVLHRRHILPGKNARPYTWFRLMLILFLIIALAAQFVSALVLSKFAFAWLPAFPGTAVARQVHIAFCYWIFVIAFIHGGFSLAPRLKKRFLQNKGWWIVAVALFVTGIVCFIQLGLSDYLLLQVAFAGADFATPLPLRALEFTAVAGMCMVLGFVVGYLLIANPGARRQAE